MTDQEVLEGQALQEAVRHLLTRWADWRGKEEGPPWNWALEEAALASVWPLVYWAFREEDGMLTGEARELGMRAYFQIARQAPFRERWLAKMLAALAAAGAPTLLVKGAVLAEVVYPSPGSRGMADVDLFVPRDRIVLAGEIMQELGYKPEGKVSLVAQQQGRAFAYAEASFHPPDEKGPLVELHWHPVITYFFRGGTRVNLAAIWERAQPVMLAGQPTLQMGAEDTLLYLCYHLVVQHRLSHLKGYVDIALIVRKWDGSLDWAVVVSRAEEWRLRPVVYWALAYTRELLGAPVPDAVLKTLRPGRWHPSLLAARFAHPRRHLAEDGSLPGSIQTLWEILMADRWVDQLRVLKEALWPRRAVMAARHSVSDSWSIYALHPQRLWRRVRKAIGFDI